MTDRISGFLVVLDKDLREDDAEIIVRSILLLRGVVSVQSVNANNNFAERVGTERFRNKLYNLLREHEV